MLSGNDKHGTNDSIYNSTYVISLGMMFASYLACFLIRFALLNASVVDINVRKHGMTLTSFLFNPNGGEPRWVDRIFGSKAIAYHTNITDTISIAEISPNELKTRMIGSRIENEYMWPICSIEMLGFGVVSTSYPFVKRARYNDTIGHANIVINNQIDMVMDCKYRPLYENWREDSDYFVNYWATVFYCPSVDKRLCARLVKTSTSSTSRITVDLNMKLGDPTTRWQTQFEADISKEKQIMTDSENKINPVGVCLSIPYTSNDVNKVHI